MMHPDEPTLLWIRSHRGRNAPIAFYREQVLPELTEAAAANGLLLQTVELDDLAFVRGADGVLSVRCDEQEIDLGCTMFHTKTNQSIAARHDTARAITTFSLLEAAGACVTIPAALNVINDDKLLALAVWGAGIRSIPTARVETRQIDRLRAGTLEFDFPMAAKPASWGAGNGVYLARDQHSLNSYLHLAGTGETPVVVQPWISDDFVDVRVYCIDGKPVAATSRWPRAGGRLANTAQGGARETGLVPPELKEPAALVASRMGTAFAGVDFLVTSDGPFLCEVEVDGGGPIDVQKSLRFAAYRTVWERYRQRRVNMN